MSQVFMRTWRTRRRLIFGAIVAVLLLILALLVIAKLPQSLNGKFVYVEASNDSQLKVRTVSGDESQILVPVDGRLGEALWSPDGKRVAFTKLTPYKNGRTGADLYVVNVDGSGLKQLTSELHPSAIAWSPNGKYIAFVEGIDRGSAIFVVDTERVSISQLTQYETRDLNPVWSPDSEHIAFVTNRDGFQEIYTMRPDGSELKRLTYTDNLNDLQPEWSPDGKRIAYITQHSVGDGTAELHIMNADGSGARQLTHSAQEEHEPSWAPDNTHIAYMGNSNTNVDIFIMNVDTGEVKQLTQATENHVFIYPRWLLDGQHLMYLNNYSSDSPLYCIMDIDGKPITYLVNGCMVGASVADWWGQ